MSHRALVSIDLGAESCRVCLLRRMPDPAQPSITMVHRFDNAPWSQGSTGLRWNLKHICHELEAGLRSCAEIASEGIATIGVTGWAVDYVRLDSAGEPLAPPFCYRDSRTATALKAVHAIIPPDQLYARTGVQIQPINTIYQLYADKLAGSKAESWVLLPEYILHWLGAPRIAEYTNATHTGLIDPDNHLWSPELFAALGVDLSSAPALVATGSVLGPLRSDLRRLPAFAGTQLIAPACHDTASAIAGIPYCGDDWAYISSGTWSLVGTVLPTSRRTSDALESHFTNLGAAGGGVLFHRGLAGMWLLRQCLDSWNEDGRWQLSDLIGAAQNLPVPDAVLDLDDPSFLMPGNMPDRINHQRIHRGLRPYPADCSAAPQYANLIFHSLASYYGVAVNKIAELTGHKPERICVVGGGSRNEYLNALTRDATGLCVERCSVESSTVGNFAVQLARINCEGGEISAAQIADRARSLTNVAMNS